MLADNFSQFISKKSYEICYALLRVSLGLKHNNFASHLEDRGLFLLDSAVREDYDGVLSASKSVEYLLRMGSDVNILNTMNSDLIWNELKQLNSAVAELEKSKNPTQIDLSDIFSKSPVVAAEEGNQQYSHPIREKVGIPVAAIGDVDRSFAEGDFQNGFNASNGNGNGNGNGFVKAVPHSSTRQFIPAMEIGNGKETLVTISGNARNAKSGGRQTAILEKIRQSGNCRLKDLQDNFSETSERTIRYDIQGLLEKGLIERLGNGGPSTYYKAKELHSYEA